MISFIETRLFTKLVGNYLRDEEYAGLQNALASNPECGKLIRGSGGVRKIRWGSQGRGKRGGVRIIYYAQLGDGVIWMLTLYAKSEADSLSPSVLRRIREELDA